MFKRGNGPLVSVLLPTRGRPQDFCESVSSLYDLAIDKHAMEFIVKVDDDDQATLDALPRLQDLLGYQLKVLKSPRGGGYKDMHLWVNEMSRMASGDWLFIWNDDARMMSNGWDEELRLANLRPGTWHGVDDVACFIAATHDRPGASEFFFLRRKVTEILGRFSFIPHNDTWVSTLMRFTESLFWLPSVVVKHNSHVIDDTRKEGLPARETLEYTVMSVDGPSEKLKDARKLIEHINANRPVTEEHKKVLDGDSARFWKMFNEPIGKVIEVGSHDEDIANVLADKGYDVYGVDLREYNPNPDNATGRKMPKRHLNYQYIRGDFCELPPEFIAEHVGTFDIAVAISCIEHFGLGTYNEGGREQPFYDVVAMRQIWQLLKPGGVAYVSLPYGGKFLQFGKHFRIYDRKAVVERIIQDFIVDTDCVFVADMLEVNGVEYQPDDPRMTWDIANSYHGNVPHISVMIKLKKDGNRKIAPDGR